jgi:glycerol-3-phosphate O-acyltransferase / dihydroxyacetone phosphate acyltransferase
MRTLLLLVCRLTLRVFFRQVEIAGLDRVPVGGNLIFAINHPNGLIDPLFILCYAGRPVSFLAKAPLFSMPVVGYFVRSFRCLPVYRRQDNHDPRQNRAMMQQAVQLLAEGSALALFPEGTSHSDPRMKPFRSGAARIALSAAQLSGAPVDLVPVGLYYSRKQVFRSSALMLFGEPVRTVGQGFDVDLEPPSDSVRQLTDEIARRIGALTLQAESIEAVDLAKLAERIIAAAERDAGSSARMNMADKLAFRQRLLAGRSSLENQREVELLVARVRTFEARMRAVGLRVDQFFDRTIARGMRYLLGTVVQLLLLAIPGLVGLAVHYPTYRVVGYLAFRYAGKELDVMATGKVLAGLLLFPVTWATDAFLVGWLSRPWIGLVTLLLLPLCGYCALLFVELSSGLALRIKGFWLATVRRSLVGELVAERRAIRDDVQRLAELLSRRQA